MSGARERLRAVALLARLMPPSSRGLTAAAVGLVVLAPLVDVAETLTVGAIARAVGPAVDAGPGSSEAAHLRSLVVALAALFVAVMVGGALRESVGRALGRRVDRHVRLRVLDVAAGPPGIAHLEDPEVADRLALARSATSPITPGAAAQGLVGVTAARLLAIAPVLLLFRFRWWVPLVIVPVHVASGRALRRHVLRSVEIVLDRTSELRHSWYAATLALTPEAAKDLRVFGLAGWLRRRYRDRWEPVMKAVWRARGRDLWRLLVAQLTAGAVDAVVIVLVVRAAGRGDIDVGELTVLLTAVLQTGRLGSIDQSDVQLQTGLAAVPALLDVEDAVERTGVRFGGTADPAGAPVRSIRFEGVTFAYPGAERPVFDGLDLELAAGTSLAVVGRNGAGKTTLVKLLARLYEPTAGRITVDGVDLRDLEPAAWQRRVAAIFQEFGRYALPVRDNVGFGALGLAGDDDALHAAARDAGAAELVDGLEYGWDTVLSRQFSGGTDLSGGEWQRIALARALLAVRGGAGVLVLDEPTAHLDVRAEAELYDRFLALTAGVTTLVISHRFSTVRRADRIVVLDEGRVVEDGTHDELVAAGGTYARMFALQSARYVDSGEVEEEVVGAG